MTFTKRLITFVILLYSKNLLSLDLTVYVNNWLTEIPETYKVHTDQYIYLDKNLSSMLSDVLDSNASFNSVRSGPKGSQTSVFTRGTNSNHTLVTITPADTYQSIQELILVPIMMSITRPNQGFFMGAVPVIPLQTASICLVRGSRRFRLSIWMKTGLMMFLTGSVAGA